MIVIPIDSMEDTARLKKAYALGGMKAAYFCLFFIQLL